MRRSPVAPVLLAGLLSAAGCTAGGAGPGSGPGGGGGAAPASTTVTASVSSPADPPHGFRRLDVPADGFTVAVPAGWDDVPPGAESIRDLAADARSGNPQLAAMLESYLDAGGEGRLLAVDADPPGANLNIVRGDIDVPAGGPEEARDRLLDPAVTGPIDAGLRSVGAHGIEREKVTLAAGPALRATYLVPVSGPDGSTSDVVAVQYYVPARDGVFILTLSTPDLGSYATDFEDIAQSFGIL